MSIHVKRTATILKPDQSRVLLRPFSPGDPPRVSRIISRILSLPENLVGPLLAEYSLESAALFNPSIVPHPDQTDLPSGALRFILSLRATGEGHISSITFR